MLSFASAPGNFFNILGKLGALVKNVRTHQLQQRPAMIDTSNGVVAQLTAEPDLQAIIGSSYLGVLTGVEGVGSLCKSLASQVVNRKVYRGNPQLSQTLTSLSTLASLLEVIRQMKEAGASVLAQTVSATPQTVSNPGPHFSGTGNGFINVSTKRPLDGQVLENAFAETLLFTCTNDSYSGGVTADNEPFTVTGTGAQGDVFAFDWPLGSNKKVTINTIDSTSDNASGNLLTNSGFDSITGNVPDDWTLVTGTAGTHIFSESSLTYDSPPNKAIRFLGDGNTPTQIRQQFNSSQNSGSLDSLSQYSVCILCRRDGVAPGAGTLTIDLFDGTNVIQDANGVNNSFNVDLTKLGTGYTATLGSFRTPAILPSTIYIRVRLSTGLTNNRSIYLDHLSLGLHKQLATWGPFLAVHSGNVPFQIGDFGNCVITNSRGAAGTLSTFQTLWYQFYPEVVSNELLLPSSTTPTISDGALIA